MHQKVIGLFYCFLLHGNVLNMPSNQLFLIAVCCVGIKCDLQNPVNTKHLYNICTMLDQRRRRWADVVQMLYKCFVFAGKVFSRPSSIQKLGDMYHAQ